MRHHWEVTYRFCFVNLLPFPHQIVSLINEVTGVEICCLNYQKRFTSENTASFWKAWRIEFVAKNAGLGGHLLDELQQLRSGGRIQKK